MSGPDSDSVSLNKFTADKVADPSTVLGTTSKIGVEHPQIPWETYSKSLKELVAYRNSINTTPVQDMATNWTNHAKKLTTLAADFWNEVNSKILDSWSSTGGGVASKAVQNYADQLSQLPSIMNAIASSLQFSAKFLEETKKNIPDERGMLIDGTTIVTHIDDSHKNYSDSGSDYVQYYTTGQWAPYSSQVQKIMQDEFRQRANDVMNQIFVPNGQAVDEAMPMFPLPQPVTQGLPDPTGKVSTPGPGPGPSLVTGPGPGPSLGLKPFTGLANNASQLTPLQKAELAKETAYPNQNTTSANSQAGTQGQDLAQQGLQAVQQAAQQGLQAAQQAAQQATQGSALDAAKNLADGMGLSGLAGLTGPGLAGLGIGGIKGGGALGGEIAAAKNSLLASEAQASKLFPRAAMAAKAEEEAVEGARAGMASSGGMGSPMGGMGAAGRGQQEKDKEKKRAEFLDSEEWLEQAMGDAPVTSKPVVDG